MPDRNPTSTVCLLIFSGLQIKWSFPFLMGRQLDQKIEENRARLDELLVSRDATLRYVQYRTYTLPRFISQLHNVHIGLGTEFRSEKIPRNRLRRRKCSFRVPRKSEFRNTEQNWIQWKKFVLQNSSKITKQNGLFVHQKSSFLTLSQPYVTYSPLAELNTRVVK